jgi:O-antigen/teichoic acid export membrane protein
MNKVKKLLKKKVIKDYFSVVGANLLLQPLKIIKGFVVANFLGPENYGILKSVELIQMLNKFGNLGFKIVANREIAHYKGEGNIEKQIKFRNTNYSSEILLALLLFIIGSCSSLFFEDKNIIMLILISSFGLLLSKIEGLFKLESAIQKKFQTSSRITVYTGGFLVILTIALVPFLKIFGVLIVNVLTFILGIYLYKRMIKFPFRFEIDKKIFKYSLKIGSPFVIATIIYGVYKYSERLLILDYIGATALGLFSFGIMISNTVSILFKASIKVRLQDIWELIGQKEYKRLNKMVIKETVLLTTGSLLIIPVIWIALDIFVPLFLKQYVNALPAARILTFIIPFQVIANYAGAVTTSKTVNNIYIPIFLRLLSITIFAGGVYYLFTTNRLTLERYAILNLCGYAFYNIGIIVNYYISFQRLYLNGPNHD